MAKRDYYDVLGVARTATSDEIKKAFRKMAMQFHPDKNPGDKKAEEKFKEANEAYETLSDTQKKQTYDQFGHFGSQRAGGGGFRPGQNPFEGFSGPQGAGAPGGQGTPENFQDIFGDIFSDLFRGRPGGPGGPSAGGAGAAGSRRTNTNARGADLRYTLNISFEEAATGCEKMITFIRQRSGKEDNARLSITVPAGVKNGQRLKLRGEGDSARASGAIGDLYVIVSIQDHSLFKRVENDVHIDVPVSFTDATLGATVDVPTLTGKASLKIPPGTPSGQVFRLKGKGFASVSGGSAAASAGDMLVRVVIDVPRELTDEQRELIIKLSSTVKNSPLIKAYQEKVDRILKIKK